jgi:hypothetical protein
MEEFYNKISDNIQYNELYSLYANILKSSKLDNYHSFMIGNSELISTLTLGLISCIKSLSILSEDEKKELTIQYIKNVINLINTTKYKHKDYESFYERISNIFKPKHKLSVSNIQSIKYSDYYDIQKHIWNLVNGNNGRYHGEYINILTLGFYAFLQTINNIDNKETSIINYLKCMIELIIIDDSPKYALFDSPAEQTILINFSSDI